VISLEKKKNTSKSQRFSKQAYEKKKRQQREKPRQEMDLKKLEKEKIKEKERKVREDLIRVMNEGRKAGISYKKTKKNINFRTQDNNISAVNSMLRELKIYDLRDITEEKIMNYLEQQKIEYKTDIKKGGYINNKVKSLQRLLDSVIISKGLELNMKKEVLKNIDFIKNLNHWKNSNKIVKSKKSSHYLKPNSQQQKLINDHFINLKKSRSEDKELDLGYKYHRFAAAVGSRISQGVGASLENIEKLEDGRYIYRVFVREDKTDKPRIKFVENKNDIKFLDRLVSEAELRADKRGFAYLFEVKDETGNNYSRQHIQKMIQEAYKKNFSKYSQKVKEKVRFRKDFYEVEQNFVPHSSRSIAIQKELKTRYSRYKRDKNRFYKDLQEMVNNDISVGYFKKDLRGSIIYGYESMVKKKGRDLSLKEMSMYLTSCSCGHNRIDVMRDHYFSKDMNDWFRRKEISDPRNASNIFIGV
jgi:hypothetical protein